MAGKRKIQDEGEVVRWIEEGKPYTWMVEEYQRKYSLQTTSGMFSNVRKRLGLDTRIARDSELIPWKIKEEHTWSKPVVLLRFLARRRQGFALKATDELRLNNWLAELAEHDAVVHYDPDTEDGFHYVPRAPGDDDVIRRPKARPNRRNKRRNTA